MQNTLRMPNISGEDKASADYNQDEQKNPDDEKACYGAMELKMQTSSSDDPQGTKGKPQKRYWTEQEVSKH